MPQPKYRTSKSKRNTRRSHHALKAPGMSVCPNCKEVKLPHSVCDACGHYRGQQMIAPSKLKSALSTGFDTEA